MARYINAPPMTPLMNNEGNPCENEDVCDEWCQKTPENECSVEQVVIQRPPEISFSKKTICCNLPLMAPRIIKKPVSIIVPKPFIICQKVKTPVPVMVWTTRIIRKVKLIPQKQIIKIPTVCYYRSDVPYKRQICVPKICYYKPLRICIPKADCDYDHCIPLCNPCNPCEYPFYPCYPGINCPDQYTNSNIRPCYSSPFPNLCPNPLPNSCSSFPNINFDPCPCPNPLLNPCPSFSNINFDPCPCPNPLPNPCSSFSNINFDPNLCPSPYPNPCSNPYLNPCFLNVM